ncbi:MAG: hypothetical protein ABIG45_02490 [Bacillota bacterium]
MIKAGRILRPVFLFVILSCIFTGTALCESIPKEFTEGVMYDRQYPDHILDLYKNAVVYDSSSHFETVVLSMGSEDELEDVILYYREYLMENAIEPLEAKKINFEEEEDELYLRFVFEGYEFEIKAYKPTRGYEKEVYNTVIFASARLATEQQGNGASSVNPTPAAPEPTQKNTAEQDEIPLTALATGSWFSISSNFSDGSVDSTDYTLYIKDGTTGTFHLFNPMDGVKADYNFDYRLVNGVLILNLGNDFELRFDAFQYYNTLRLISHEDGNKISFLNWEDITGVRPSDASMTALGDWIYPGAPGGSPVIMGLWGNGGSMLYGILGYNETQEAAWSFNDGTLAFPYNEIYADFQLHLEHRGNVLVAQQSDGRQLIFNRVSAGVLAGSYRFYGSNEPDLANWDMLLAPDGSSSHDITADGSSFMQDNISWFVNYYDGTLNIMLNGDQHIYYYHLDQTWLYLYEPIAEYFYRFYIMD